ncbi:WAT1-related protein At5g40240-like [Bidens hawaiensis]|uniref:WAT1-related protein At5g40240-like n=1 Tax=Bidens hawaiensis TaxID=980011 RepID=UPI004049A198
MARRRSDETWLWITNEVLPIVAMLMTTCLDMSTLTIVKAAMNGGLGSIVYVVYHNFFAILIFLPFFIVHVCRNVDRPRLTFHILFRFFILGLLGICLFQVLLYVGVSYSTPTMASAISNTSPAITFVLAVIFRMEKLEMQSPSSAAKLLGTIMAVSGAMVFTFYQGLEIFTTHDSHNLLHSSQPSNWEFGGLIIFLAAISGCIWSILQSATAKEFPDQFSILFFICLFGTLQCIAISPFLEPNPNAWVVQPGIGMIAIIFGVSHVNYTKLVSIVSCSLIDMLYLKAVFSIVFRISALTWCLEKKGPVFVAVFSPLSIVIG